MVVVVVEALRVCPVDKEPVIWRFEFKHAEYHCVVCGWLGGIFDAPRLEASPELIARHAELEDRYETERAARDPRFVTRPRPDDVEPPVCGGCGKTATGRLDHSGKPAHWYSRTKDGVTEYACSRECIREGAVLPW